MNGSRERCAPGAAHRPDGAGAQEGLSQALQATLTTAVETASQWLALAELEARDAASRVVLALSMALAAVIVAVAAWLFAASAGVAALVAGGASLTAALALVAAINLLLVAAALWALWRNLRSPWFQATRRQLALVTGAAAEQDHARVTH